MYRFEEYELSVDTYQLLRAGEEVKVQPQVFDVLAYLIEHRDRVVSKEELLDSIWGDRFVSESALTSRIKSARQALGDDGRTQRLIRNSHGRGYRFVGEVETIGGEASEAAPLDRPDVAALDATDVGPTWQPTERLSLLVDEQFPFVGRVDIVHTAQAQIADVAAGATGALLIGGQPGLGKTRLAAELARRVAGTGDALALGGRCDRQLASSLQPWLEALGNYVQTAPEGQLRTDTEGIADHLGRVFPTLESRLGGPEAPRTAPPDDYATIDAVVVLLERISARKPLLIVLDDVQWAGGPTRALASLLLRRGTARVLLVLTFRSTVDDLGESGRRWLAELGAHRGVETVELAGLRADEVEVLVRHALGDEGTEIGNQVFARSEGHTLFATELLRDVVRGVGPGGGHMPQTVAELVRTRLDQLDEPVARLVSVGAAVGQDFELQIVAEAAGLTLDETLDAVDVAVGASLIYEVRGAHDRFRFAHQLVPAAVLESMSNARRVRLHARLAEVLETHDGPAIEIAHHLIEACAVLDAPTVIERVRTVAANAVTEHRYDGAASLLARCAELPMDERTRAEIRSDLGQAYNMAGHQPQALEPFERTAAAGRQHGWDDLLVQAALGRWGVSPFRASQDRTVLPLLDEALALDGVIDDRTRARLLAKRAAFNLFTGDLRERDEVSRRAVALVGPDAGPERLEVLEGRWMAIACPATVHEVDELDAELNVLRKELGALTTDACAPEIGAYWLGRGDELWAIAEQLAADPRQRRDVDQWRTTTLTATRALFDGRFAEARVLTDKALPLGREPWGEAGRVVHALVHLAIDRLDGRTEASLERWVEIERLVPSDSMRATRAWVEAVAGDRDVANELVDLVSPGLERLAENYMGGFGLVGYSLAVLALERDDLFEAVRAVLRPLSDRMLGHPWAPSLAAAHPLSRLDQIVGDRDAAEASRQAASQLYEGLGATTFVELLDQHHEH